MKFCEMSRLGNIKHYRLREYELEQRKRTQINKKERERRLETNKTIITTAISNYHHYEQQVTKHFVGLVRLRLFNNYPPK